MTPAEVGNVLVATGAEHVYGGPGVQERAAAWATERGLTRSSTCWRCAHGLTRRGRHWPCGCASFDRILDHANLWVRAGRPAVLLTHPYYTPADLTEEAEAYAADHGLTVTIGDPADAWYGLGTTPVRFEVAAGRVEAATASSDREEV
jgi:hypothetical protein